MAPVFGHGRLRLYLLTLLDESPRHGYELIRLMEDRFLGLYAPSAGTIYPRLARLETEGLITHDVVGGRKVYRLTDAGRAELRDRMGELDSLETEIGDSVRELAHQVGGVVGDEVRDTARDVRDEFGQTVRDLRRARAGRPAPVWASFLSYLEQRVGTRPPDEPTAPDVPAVPESGDRPTTPHAPEPPDPPAGPEPAEAQASLGLPEHPVVLEPGAVPDRPDRPDQPDRPASHGDGEEFLDRLQDFRDQVRDTARDALRDPTGPSAAALHECAEVLSDALSRIRAILAGRDLDQR